MAQMTGYLEGSADVLTPRSRSQQLSPKEVVASWVAAFNRGDARELAGFYTETAVNHQIAENPIAGRAAIHRMFEQEFKRTKMVCRIENLFEVEDWAILEWSDPFGVRGCGFFRCIDGKIAFQRGYWDKLSFLRAHKLPVNA